MEVNQKVLVYTDGIVGWEVGELKDKYRIAEESALEKDKKIKAKINFKSWDLDEWSQTCDDPKYFSNLFSNKEEVYEMRWDGKEFFELMNAPDEREGTLFEIKDLIILEV